MDRDMWMYFWQTSLAVKMSKHAADVFQFLKTFRIVECFITVFHAAFHNKGDGQKT